MNNTIFFSLYNLAHQSTILDKFIVFCAEYLPYLVIIFLIIFILYHSVGEFDWKRPFYILKKRFREFFVIFSPAIMGWVIVEILKSTFNKPRPFIKFAEIVKPLFIHGGMDSFPSGHATFFGALALSVFFVNKKVGWLCVFIALIIGIARVISGIHFPIDILAGYILGVIVVLVFHLFVRKI